MLAGYMMPEEQPLENDEDEDYGINEDEEMDEEYTPEMANELLRRGLILGGKPLSSGVHPLATATAVDARTRQVHESFSFGCDHTEQMHSASMLAVVVSCKDKSTNKLGRQLCFVSTVFACRYPSACFHTAIT